MAQTTRRDTLAALLFTPVGFIADGIGYAVRRHNLRRAALRTLHDAKVQDESQAAGAFRAGTSVEDRDASESALKEG